LLYLLSAAAARALHGLALLDILPRQAAAAEFLSVAFSPDGATLAAGDGDNDVRLWDVSHLTNVVSSLCASLTHAEWSASLSAEGHQLTLCS
jgi:WD40 repeat protein